MDAAEYETLHELVKRYSPTGQEAEAVAYLVGRMKALGYDQAYVDAAGNAVGIKGSGKRQSVLLGHIDTVPGEIPLRVEGNLLYGRGAVDAKGALAAFVDGAAGLDVPDDWQVIVIGAVEAEGDSKGAGYVAEPAYAPVSARIGEPGRWQRLTLGYKGSAWARISLRRAMAHSASQNENACEAAFAVWQKVKDWQEEFNQQRTQVFDQLLLTLRDFSSGEDGFAHWAHLFVAARLPLDLPPLNWYDQLTQTCAEMGAEVEALGYAMPAYRAEKNTPLVRAFLSAIRTAGGQPGFVLKSGTADMNIVCRRWNCAAFAYGPGDSALDHTPNEHVPLEEYALAVKVLRTGLQALLN